MSNILSCNNCSGALQILAKDGPNLQTKCTICGFHTGYVKSALKQAVQNNHVAVVSKKRPAQYYDRDEAVGSRPSWR